MALSAPVPYDFLLFDDDGISTLTSEAQEEVEDNVALAFAEPRRTANFRQQCVLWAICEMTSSGYKVGFPVIQFLLLPTFKIHRQEIPRGRWKHHFESENKCSFGLTVLLLCHSSNQKLFLTFWVLKPF